MANQVSHDSETPAEGQQVITANALIYHNFDGVTKIFLPKRAETKKFLPSVYELPGGHIDYDEDIVEGLQREVMEEFGVGIQVGDPFRVFTYINPIKGSHSIEVAFFAKLIDSVESIQVAPEDHSGFLWITEDEIDKAQLITPEELKTVRKAFSLLKGESIKFS